MQKIVQKCLVLMMLLGGAQAFAWQLVYHTDASGNEVSGSLDALKEAIRDGDKVRIGRGNDGAFYDTQMVLIKNDIVYAQTHKVLAVQFAGDVLKFYPGGYYTYYNIDSTGRITSLEKKLTHATEVHFHATSMTELKWYVE